jgi:hypothetical protein
MESTEITKKVREWLRASPPQWFRAEFKDGDTVEVRRAGQFSISPDGTLGLVCLPDGETREFVVAQDLERVDPLPGNGNGRGNQ